MIQITNPVSPRKNYEYPGLELNEILQQFSHSLFDERKIRQILEDFKRKILQEYNVLKEESKYFQFKSFSREEHEILIKVGNLFTAALIYGRYVPYDIIKNYSSTFIFPDGNKIEYVLEQEDYVYVKCNPISDSASKNLTKAESEKELEDSFPSWTISEEIPLLQHEENQEMIQKFKAVKDRLTELSEEELSSVCSQMSGEKFKIIYQEIQRRREITLQEFRVNNPGVPDNATKLEREKKYSGQTDGDFEIRTINGELWFIPLSSCVDFGEDL